MWLYEMKSSLCTGYIFTKTWNRTFRSRKSQWWHNCVHTVRSGPKSLRRAGLSGRFWIWVSSAAGGAHFISVDILASTSPLCAVSCICMKNSCLIRYMRNSIGFLKIKETGFVVSTHQSNCQFLILGRFGEATKISILSNDQTCLLCKVGSIVYSISCTPEATDLN